MLMIGLAILYLIVCIFMSVWFYAVSGAKFDFGTVLVSTILFFWFGLLILACLSKDRREADSSVLERLRKRNRK